VISLSVSRSTTVHERVRGLTAPSLQAIRPGGKSISQHRNVDSAWLEVTQQLDRVLAKLERR
jgi:hypothetical protein